MSAFSVYATTAANSHESSYACYYDEKRSTYLGDWYSVNWMEDSDVVGDVSSVVFAIKDFHESCHRTRCSSGVCLHVPVTSWLIKSDVFIICDFCRTLCLQEDLKKETLLKQFKIVKNHTNTSHVQQFGNKVKKPKLLDSLCV